MHPISTSRTTRRTILTRRAIAAVLLAVAVVGLGAACTKKNQNTRGGDLPAGDVLLKESAAAMRQVQTVRFAIEADGTVSGLPLRKAGGQLKKDGDAKGTATLEQGGVPVDLEFVVSGNNLHVKGLTGGWQKYPLALAATIYDPSAILDPNRGIAKVLETATGARSEDFEKVNGVDTVRVAATPDASVLTAVVPGASQGVTGKFWVSTADKRLVKAQFGLPAKGSDKGATVTVTFSEFDAPVTVSAP